MEMASLLLLPKCLQKPWALENHTLGDIISSYFPYTTRSLFNTAYRPYLSNTTSIYSFYLTGQASSVFLTSSHNDISCALLQSHLFFLKCFTKTTCISLKCVYVSLLIHSVIQFITHTLSLSLSLSLSASLMILNREFHLIAHLKPEFIYASCTVIFIIYLCYNCRSTN